MVYIRKLSKKANLYKIKGALTNGIVESDVLKQELGTSNNTLSFWKCSDISNTKDAMKAILLSTTGIETSQFIIVEEDMLEKYGIDVDDKEEGVTAYRGQEKSHINFCNLNYKKIGLILEMIKELASNEALTPELKREEVKQYINEVKNDGLLDEDILRPELKRAINKYCNDIEN